MVGYVYDDTTLSPVLGATAKVGTATSAPTSTAGAFTIAGAPTGNRTLSVFKTGYATKDVQVWLAAGGNNVGVIYLPAVQTPGLGAVTGWVQDSGAAVADAMVVAGGKTAKTKPNGAFAIYNITPGDVTVTAQSGPKIGRVVVNVVPDGTATANLSLSVSPPPPPVI